MNNESDTINSFHAVDSEASDLRPDSIPDVMLTNFNILVIRESTSALNYRVFVPYKNSSVARKGEHISHYVSCSSVGAFLLSRADSGWAIFRSESNSSTLLSNQVPWLSWTSNTLDFPLNQQSEWTGETTITLTFELVSLHELHQPLRIDRYHLWGLWLHTFLNGDLQNKKTFARNGRNKCSG